MEKVVYVIGQLKNPMVPIVGGMLRDLGVDAYDQWFCPGPEADVYWQAYCKARGWSYKEALTEWHAKHISEIDKFHLDRAHMGVVVYPAGKSALLEAGYLIGSGKPVVLAVFEDPERFDVMPAIVLTHPSSAVVESIGELADYIRQWLGHKDVDPHPIGKTIDVDDDGFCLCHKPGIKVV